MLLGIELILIFTFLSFLILLFFFSFEIILTLTSFSLSQWGSKLYKIRSSFYLFLFTIFGSVYFLSCIIILLLISVFPANIYLYVSETAREMLSVSKGQALFRIPFQIPLIIIAYWHSTETHSKELSIICSGLFIPTIIYFITI